MVAPEFDVIRAQDGVLGAPAAEVAQSAVDATETAYANDSGIDVERRLGEELSSRGLRASNGEWLGEAARRIRSGHHVTVSRPGGATGA
jgi:hypothetical protein